MAAQVTAIGRIQAVGLDHQGHGVPAHVGAQPAFQLEIARAALLVVGLDGVDVARVGRERHVNTVLPRFLQQLLQQEVRAIRTFSLDDGRQRVQPLAGFLGIDVVVGGAGGLFWRG